MLSIHSSARVSKKAELRVRGNGAIILHDNVVIDDYVRIVAAEGMTVEIGCGAKIGVGTIINGGANINIGKLVSIYGYCYFHGSTWHVEEKPGGGEGKIYYRKKITIGSNSKVYEFTSLYPGVVIGEGQSVPPHSVLGFKTSR